MKKTLLLLTSVLAICSLVACSRGVNEETTNKPDIPTSSENLQTSATEPSPIPGYVDFPELKEGQIGCTVYYFASSAFADKSQALAKGKVALGELLPKPKSDPVTPDLSFNKFLGWSHKILMMSDDDIWDFENDRLPGFVQGLTFCLYGQWDYIE